MTVKNDECSEQPHPFPHKTGMDTTRQALDRLTGALPPPRYILQAATVDFYVLNPLPLLPSRGFLVFGATQSERTAAAP
jgi:hypothetical protein